jgi:DNA polymerase-3 subunit delta'
VDHHPDILIPRHPPATKEDEKKRDRANPTTKRSIPIDEIRALQHRLTTRPTLGSRACDSSIRRTIWKPARSMLC